MTTAVDTNVFVALWNADDSLNLAASKALESVQGRLVVCGAVYSELLASPGRTEDDLDRFFDQELIEVEWGLTEEIWRAAGNAFSGYASRRRKANAGHPRRILTDFIIGAHAFENRYGLLTLDDKLFRASFPKLRLIRF